MAISVVVTGASRGLGLALAGAFAQRGARVFAGRRSSAPALDALGARHPRAMVAIELDVTSEDSVRQASLDVAAEVAAIDVLVNCAAIRSRTVSNPLETIDFDDVKRTFDVNAIGALRTVRSFLPLLSAAAAPLVLNVSSEAGSLGTCSRDREFDYCMSKAALNMATVLLANYLRGRVRVLSMHPGWLRTDMGGPNADFDPDDVAARVAAWALGGAPAPDGAHFVDHLGMPLPY